MGSYQKVLVAVDINDQSDKLLGLAAEFIQKGREVHLCTAVLPVESMYSMAPVGGYALALGGFQDEMRGHAEHALSVLAERLDVSKDNTHIFIGKASTEIKEHAEEGGFDLILVGTHGKGVIRSLMGSTSNGVLHGAPCDVLALKY